MEEGSALFLRGGTLVDVRRGERIPNASLFLNGERITRVGTYRDEPPPGAEVIDTDGAWLVPGLVDMHVHLTAMPLHSRLLPLYPAHGVTTVRDVGGHLTELALLRDDIRARRRVGPRLFFAGPLLDGLPPLWPGITVLVDTIARARSAVRMLIDQDVDCLKVYNSVPAESLEVIATEGHAAGRSVIGHVPRSLSMTRALELGMDCLEHIRVTGRELLPPDDADRIDPLPLGTRETLLWERFDPQSPGMERLIARLADDRIFLDPTLLVDLATFDRVPDDPAAEAVIEAFPETMRSELRQSRWMADLRPPEELAERARAGLAKRFDFIGRCNDAGVRLLAGTDTFGPGALLPGASLINELELLQQAGLSPLQVLQAATITAAAALGQEDDLGTLEEGKLADVVVLDADPLVDIRHVREIRLTVRGGQTCTPQRLIAEVSTGEESKS